MEGQTYPTVAMLEVSLELKRLAESNDASGYEAFSTRYILDTGLTTLEDMMNVMVLFKLHASDVREASGFKEKIVELENLKEVVKAPIEVIGEFYCRLVDLYRTGRRVFYVRLADKKTTQLVDLDEKDARLITIEECGTCKTKPAKLFECLRCRKAAYCNAECQRKDWAFHKHFCSLFATSSNNNEMNK